MPKPRYNDAFRRAVESSGLALRQIAEASGVSLATLSAWTRNINALVGSPAQREAVAKVCAVIGASPDEVWGAEPVAPPSPASMIPPGEAIAELLLRTLMDTHANKKDRELAYQTIMAWLHRLF